jgi:hypothetical protein
MQEDERPAAMQIDMASRQSSGPTNFNHDLGCFAAVKANY